jgi:hypothetical protein
MTLPWLRRLVAGLSPRRPGSAPRSIHVGFMMDKVAMRQVSSEFFGFPLSISFHRGSPYSYITFRINKIHVGGCSSETSSHSTDINMNKVNHKYIYAFLTWILNGT